LNHWTSKMVLGYNNLVTPTCYALEHWELSSIIHPLTNIIWGSSLERTSCGIYPIETRRHILHKYNKFNKYWNLKRNTITHFTLFLQLNPSAFSFDWSITICSMLKYYYIVMVFLFLDSLFSFSFSFFSLFLFFSCFMLFQSACM